MAKYQTSFWRSAGMNMAAIAPAKGMKMISARAIWSKFSMLFLGDRPEPPENGQGYRPQHHSHGVAINMAGDVQPHGNP